MFNIGDTVRFRYSGYISSDLKSHTNKIAVIIHRLEDIDEEVGSMYQILFSDGFECDAYEDELTFV